MAKKLLNTTTKKSTFIPIVFITDDNYVIPTAVAIESLIENKNSNTKYEIFIISTCLSNHNIDLFKEFSSRTIRINIIKECIDDIAGLHKYDSTGVCQATPSALLKFKLPIILNKYSKVIYLDGDILVRKDLSALYNVGLKDNYVAAVHDTGKLYSHKPILTQIPHYFNSGVMLLNLKLCRAHNMTEQLIELKKKSTDMSLMDQNILNIAFQNKVILLDVTYNFLSLNLHRASSKFSIDNLNSLFNSGYKSLRDIDNNAYVLHFASKDKPWKYIDGLYSEEWYKYFKKSPYKNHHINRIKFSALANNIKKHKIVISLTSYPARIETVNQTIETLLNQSLPADNVILWLAPEQFPNREKDLPNQLLDLCDKGLTIDWYHDIRSYKKLIPTLKKYPKALIITADDDLLYPNFWVESLYKNYLSDPDVIWCHRAHAIRITENKIAPYKQWQQNIQKNQKNASYTNFCTTGAGVLYPPDCFHHDVLKENIFIKLAPNADDLWFWAMLILNNKKIKTVSYPMEKLVCIEGSQDTALYHNNVNGGKNDEQLAKLVKKYPQIKKLCCPKKQLNIKPYLLFPYYLIAMVFMKYIKIPVLKFVKHTKQICYSHSHRGKMDMLNKNFTNIMQSVTSVKNDMTNQITQIKNQQSNLEKQIADLKNTVAKTRNAAKNIADVANQ